MRQKTERYLTDGGYEGDKLFLNKINEAVTLFLDETDPGGSGEIRNKIAIMLESDRDKSIRLTNEQGASDVLYESDAAIIFPQYSCSKRLQEIRDRIKGFTDNDGKINYFQAATTIGEAAKFIGDVADIYEDHFIERAFARKQIRGMRKIQGSFEALSEQLDNAGNEVKVSLPKTLLNDKYDKCLRELYRELGVSGEENTINGIAEYIKDLNHLPPHLVKKYGFSSNQVGSVLEDIALELSRESKNGAISRFITDELGSPKYLIETITDAIDFSRAVIKYYKDNPSTLGDYAVSDETFERLDMLLNNAERVCYRIAADNGLKISNVFSNFDAETLARKSELQIT